MHLIGPSSLPFIPFVHRRKWGSVEFARWLSAHEQDPCEDSAQ
jgi:hypothetical protein